MREWLVLLGLGGALVAACARFNTECTALGGRRDGGYTERERLRENRTDNGGWARYQHNTDATGTSPTSWTPAWPGALQAIGLEPGRGDLVDQGHLSAGYRLGQNALNFCRALAVVVWIEGRHQAISSTERDRYKERESLWR